MKKYFALLLLLPLVFGGCDDDKSYTETWTVAPEKGVTGSSWVLVMSRPIS